MNPLTNVRNQQKINEKELSLGIAGTKSSWHQQYKDSAWVFVGGLPFDLTEGDIICVFSQYGEVVNINLVRDKAAGKSKGFCFLCYEDQRSTILAVDNLNGFKLLGRTLRVDHVANYRPPKETGEEDDITQMLHQMGCAPEPVAPASSLKDKVKEKPSVTRDRGSNRTERDVQEGGRDKGRRIISPPSYQRLQYPTSTGYKRKHGQDVRGNSPYTDKRANTTTDRSLDKHSYKSGGQQQ